MSRKPEFGFLVAAASLVVLALGWTMVLLPHGSFPIIIRDDEHRGAYAALVRPGPNAGIAVGDPIDLAPLTYAQHWRLQVGSPPGTRLTLRVQHGGAWSDRTIAAIPRTIDLRNAFWASTLVELTIGVLIGALVVARRPSIATAAFAYYTWGALPSFTFENLFSGLPDPVFAVVTTVIETLITWLPPFALLIFITRFPSDPVTPTGRLRARVAELIVVLLAAACAVYAVFEPVRHQTWNDSENLLNVGATLAGLVFAALTYRDASGHDRRRIGWVIVGYAVTMLSDAAVNWLIVQKSGLNATPLVIGNFLATALPLTMAYAILRHRVLDIGFALNRTVVYASVTAVVVVTVSFVDWLTGRLISEARIALAAEAAVTIGLGVMLSAVHARVERVVERVLFRARHVAERRLRNGIESLAFATTDAAIERALTDEAAAALDLRSAALFRADESGEAFRAVRTIGWPQSPASITADALLVRTLHLRERPFHLADYGIADPALPSGSAAPTIALPVADRHALLGFVLYGAQTDGTDPDPELVDLLGQLAAAAASAYAYADARAARARLADVEHVLAASLPAGMRTV